jgi:hypothetical protein
MVTQWNEELIPWITGTFLKTFSPIELYSTFVTVFIIFLYGFGIFMFIFLFFLFFELIVVSITGPKAESSSVEMESPSRIGGDVRGL